eukprot:symbB.v1.2.003619.t1/scaffold203.1/size271217/11
MGPTMVFNRLALPSRFVAGNDFLHGGHWAMIQGNVSKAKAPLDPSFTPQPSQAPERFRGTGSFSGQSQASWARGTDPLRDRSGSNMESESPQGFSGGYGGGYAAPATGNVPASTAVVSSAAPTSGAVSYTGGRTAPIVVGAAPSAATAAEDSDEDLAGWDR